MNTTTEYISTTDLARCFFLFCITEFTDNPVDAFALEEISSKKELVNFFDSHTSNISSDVAKQVDNLQGRYIRKIDNLVKDHFKQFLKRAHSKNDNNFDYFVILQKKGLSAIEFRYISKTFQLIQKLDYGQSNINKILAVQQNVDAFNPYVNQDFFDLIANLAISEYKTIVSSNNLSVSDVAEVDEYFENCNYLINNLSDSLSQYDSNYDELNTEQQKIIVNRLVFFTYYLEKANEHIYIDNGPFDGIDF